jgi:CelD/BcsL family acetyltransferase involved in cellulose biosynthesis
MSAPRPRRGGMAAATTPARPGAARWAAPVGGHGLRVEVVTDLDDLVALTEPWSALLYATPDATAYASPAYVLTWYRHFEVAGGIHAVTVWRGDTLVGMAPFARTDVGWGPARATLLVSAGTEHGDYGDPLLGPDPAAVADAIVDHLAALTRRRTVVHVRRLRVDGPAWAAIYARPDLGRESIGRVADAAVVRFDQMDDPASTLRRLARRHDVPRNLRRLAEAHGDVTYVASDDDVPDALDAMRSMRARRWQGGEGPRLFRSPALEAFTRESVAELVAAKLGRVDSLAAGGRRLTVSTVLQVGDRQVGDSTVIDPDFSRFGPGQAALAFQLEHGLETGVRSVDLRAGEFPHKQRWANATIRTRSLALTPPGRQGEVLRRARRVATSVRSRRLARLTAS